MCVFVSAGEPVDVVWINKVVLITPDGLDADPEVQVMVNGLIRPESDCDKVVLSCVHIGEIYALKDTTAEWLNVKKDKNEDWLSNRILNNPELSPVPRIGRSDNGDLFFHFEDEKEFITKIPNHKQNNLSDVEIYCSNEDRKHLIDEMPAKARFDKDIPIYSAFQLSLNKSESDCQLFRITFRTKANVRPYHSQVNVDIEGPDAMLARIKRNINKKASNQARRDMLNRQIDSIPEFGAESDLEIAIVSYPKMSLTIESAENTGTKFPVEFPLESMGTSIKSDSCEVRVAFFSSNKNNVIIKAVATPALECHRKHSSEFIEMLGELRAGLRSDSKSLKR